MRLDLYLSRAGGPPLPLQIAFQIELKILRGEIPLGQRLPSARSLARRLKVHPNTVIAAYRILKIGGNVQLARGSGTFVARGAHSAGTDHRSLEELLEDAVRTARLRGHTGREIRSSMEAWLTAPLPGRVVAVHDSLETAEIMAHELRQALEVPVSACDLRQAAMEPDLLLDALAVALPSHADQVRRLGTGAPVAVLALRPGSRYVELLSSLSEGSVVLVISHSERVLPYAKVVVESLRAKELVLKCRLLRETARWECLVPAADLVFADVLALPRVCRVRASGIEPLLLLEEGAAAQIRDELAFGLPRAVPVPTSHPEVGSATPSPARARSRVRHGSAGPRVPPSRRLTPTRPPKPERELVARLRSRR